MKYLLICLPLLFIGCLGKPKHQIVTHSVTITYTTGETEKFTFKIREDGYLYLDESCFHVHTNYLYPDNSLTRCQVRKFADTILNTETEGNDSRNK